MISTAVKFRKLAFFDIHGHLISQEGCFCVFLQSPLSHDQMSIYTGLDGLFSIYQSKWTTKRDELNSTFRQEEQIRARLHGLELKRQLSLHKFTNVDYRSTHFRPECSCNAGLSHTVRQSHGNTRSSKSMDCC